MQKAQRNGMKRSSINPISAKRAIEITQYDALTAELLTLSCGKSEIDGVRQPLVCHHIYGRVGKRYLDPFNLVLVTPEQHREIHKHNTPEQKARLAALVRPIRIKQGWSEANNEGGKSQ